MNRLRTACLALAAIAALTSVTSTEAQAQDTSTSISRTYHVGVVKMDFFSGGTWTQHVLTTDDYGDAIFMYNLLQQALEDGVIDGLINSNWRSTIIDVTFRTDFNLPIMQTNRYLGQPGYLSAVRQ